MAASSNASGAKAKRYDRQLRIWGAHGQDALEQAHICLLNAGGDPKNYKEDALANSVQAHAEGRPEELNISACVQT